MELLTELTVIKMSKLIVEIPDELHKSLKIMAIELRTTLRVLVISILALTVESNEDTL